MLAVGLGPVDVLLSLEKLASELTVAAINSSQSMTLSGDREAVDQLYQILLRNKIFARTLKLEGSLLLMTYDCLWQPL